MIEYFLVSTNWSEVFAKTIEFIKYYLFFISVGYLKIFQLDLNE